MKIGILTVVGCSLALAGCQNPAVVRTAEMLVAERPATQDPEAPTYRLGVTPGGSTRELWSRCEPLTAAINDELKDIQIRLSSAQTEDSYLSRLRRGDFDFAIVEPHRVLPLEKLHYSVIASTGARDRIRGVIVVKKSNSIRSFRDLRGKTIVYGPPSGLAPLLVQERFFESGLTGKHGVRWQPVGNASWALVQLASANGVAAGVGESEWERFKIDRWKMAESLQVRWMTESLPGAAVMVHARVPAGALKQFRAALVGLSHSETGKFALANFGVTQFRMGEEASYDSLWEFLQTHRRHFGQMPKSENLN